MRITVGVATLALVLAGCGSGTSSETVGGSAAKQSQLQTASDACAVSETKLMLKVAGYGHSPDEVIRYESGSVLVTTPDPQGDKMAAVAFATALCVLKHTGAPPSIQQAMGASTALSGRQTDTYAKVKVGWSYNGSSPSSFEASFDPT